MKWYEPILQYLLAWPLKHVLKEKTRMKFSNEEDFRRWIISELPNYLTQGWVILHGKNVSDIVLCWNDDVAPLIMFIEAKYHKSKHGRIGFGDNKGKGYQMDVLLKRPAYTEKYLRWIIADQDSKRCLFFDNNEVRRNCAGEICEGKQNNFTSGLFEKNERACFQLEDAPQRIADWAQTIKSSPLRNNGDAGN